MENDCIKPHTHPGVFKMLVTQQFHFLNLAFSNFSIIFSTFQCQATVVGFLGSVVAIVMGALKSHEVELDHALLLCASSLVTASVASFVLGVYNEYIVKNMYYNVRFCTDSFCCAGLITAAVIVLSRHCNINPDNVATPIAASLGDITSLSLLSYVSTELYYCIG